MDPKRIDVRIRGRVQGVGYRYFAQEKAIALGLTGWVRNLSNGDVEASAEGPEASLKAWIQALERGPACANVTAVHTDWQSSSQKFSGFNIR